VFEVYAGGAGLEVEGWAAAAFGWLVVGFVKLCSPFAFGLVALASLIGIAVSGLTCSIFPILPVVVACYPQATSSINRPHHTRTTPYP